MRTVIILLWVFAGTAETLVLQPSVKNESVEVATRMEEIYTLQSKRMEEEGRGTFEEEDQKLPSGQQKRDKETLQEKTFGDEREDDNTDKRGHDFVHSERGTDKASPSQVPGTVSQDLKQGITSLTTPSLSLHVQPLQRSTVTSAPQLSSGITQEALTEASHLFVTVMSTPLTRWTIANAKSSATKKGNSRPRPEMKLEVPPTAMAARAGPTSLSLPNTFRTQALPETMDKHVKDNQVAKVKKSSKHKANKKKTQSLKHGKKVKKIEKDEMTTAPYFPYFKDHYCPPECACYGRVVQCSDKELEKIPYGIPFNSRYVLLMNNHINSIPLDLLSEYLSMEFLVLSNNCLADSSVEGVFEGIQALIRLFLEGNNLQSIPADLPSSLEELRLDRNRVRVMSEAAFSRCPGLLVLSLSNNSLGNGSSMVPAGVLSPLTSLRTLSLSHNQLTTVPLQLPLSLQELYLRGNLIQRFQGGVFQGKAELQVLDLSLNRLTNKGLGKAALINTTCLESLNLQGNFLKNVPRHLPRSIKTLNLEGNLISSISKSAFLSLPHLEHLGLARNKISKVAPGAFRMLPQLHQLDLSHNSLWQVPRQLPAWLVTIDLTHNKIQTVPRDAFCWATHDKSRLVRVHLENNLVNLGSLDSLAFSCLRGFQVVHFY